MNKMLYVMIILLISTGCMPTKHAVTEDKYKPLIEQSLKSERAPANQHGSLWGDVHVSTLFSHPTAHRVGDLVTVLVSENASATRSLGMKKNKKSNRKAALTNLFGVETALSKTLTPSAALDISSEKNFDGSGSTTNSDTLTASVTSIVMEVFPNGNMRIRGRKQITINHQPQVMIFTGIIRREDISSTNTISSSKVAQAIVSYGGGGELATVAHEGWFERTLDVIWPF
ncbi:MAG: flagellar basal body L-ring protein FlgH [Mariprofundaceae bacterium]